MQSMSDAQLIMMSLVDSCPGLTAEELKQLAVQSLYVDFFQASESLALLLQADLLSETVRQNEQRRDVNGKLLSRIDLTAKGEGVLVTLKNQLPQPVQIYLRQFEDQLQQPAEVIADFEPDPKQGWQVKLGHHNGRYRVIDVDINVPNREQAQLFAANWQKKYAQIYQYLISELSE